jgi:glycosyltransferase involved in cell wall biosynthesis
MQLVIIHYHWRPGGVRQVVENLLPVLTHDQDLAISGLTLAAGEPPPPTWSQTVQASVNPRVPIQWLTEPWLRYASEWLQIPPPTPETLVTAATKLLHHLPKPAVVLLQNPAVGRHPLIASTLAAACQATHTRLVCHHHDFFFDGRWSRWPEWQAAGLSSLPQAITASIPSGPDIRHIAVSSKDAAWLKSRSPAAWCPNPVETTPVHAAESTQAAAWLRHRLPPEKPVWLVPCRLLRRKNIAEAVLLARLLDPEVVVVTTGGPSSADEATYARALHQAAAAGQWPLHLGLLAGTETIGSPHPSVPALMSASTAVIVTSLFEGFGLPVMEASSLGVRCLARRAACPDHIPPSHVHAYDDLWIPQALAGGNVEISRQRPAWARWKALMPPEAAHNLPEPAWWQHDHPISFSRLTFAGQSTVINQCQHQAARAALLLLNPWLATFLSSSPSHPPPPVVTSTLEPTTVASALRADPSLQPQNHGSSHRPTPAAANPPASRLHQVNSFPLLWPGGDTFESASS